MAPADPQHRPKPGDPYVYRREPFPWRFAIYGAVILYLFVDLYWLGGPLRRHLFRSPAGADGDPPVAVVYGEPIRASELEAALDSFLDRHDSDPGTLTGTHAIGTRLRVLDRLVEEKLVHLFAREDAQPASPSALKREAESFGITMGRPPSEAERQEIEDRLRAIDWIESRIEQAIATSDAEVDAWLAGHPEALDSREAVRIRHVFLGDRSPDGSARRAEIESYAAGLASGASTLEDLAVRISEDPESRTRGGDAGWFIRASAPPAMIGAVWDLPIDQPSPPFLTPDGWHVAAVTERRTAPTPDADAVRIEARRRLENGKRYAAVQSLRQELRRRASEHVVIFHHAIAELGK